MIPPAEILAEWNLTDGAKPAPDAGLINDTFIVGTPPTGVLQRVNPIFGPDIHLDIEAITTHLEDAGLRTPRLVRTTTEKLCVPTQEGAWRLLTYVPGSTIHTIRTKEQASNAAALVGRFHRALETLEHTFHFVRPGAHDTLAHMELLRSTIASSESHPLLEETRTMADEILQRWESWDGVIELPTRICHGDLKISNIRFDKNGRNALCLIDLDTLSHQTIAVEMGDAWRSWCNPAGEDDPKQARFDLDIFESSAEAWLQSGPQLTDEERDNLVLGIERICLELSARFCADAIRQCYFKEDRARFAEPGTHNLFRAAGQLQVARSVRKQRAVAEHIITSR
mgnify:CR=1 FL=1